MFGIFASITIKPGHLDDFQSLIRETAQRSVAEEPGCLRFDVFRDQKKANRFMLYEVYVDEAAFELHVQTEHVKRTLEGTKIWADSPFEVIRADSVFPEQQVFYEKHKVERSICE